MLFRLSHVTKTYGPITALRQLCVEAAPGAVGLLGPNGAGKTTLIRTLLGLITIDAGAGEVLGLDMRTRRLDIRQRVGFMPEDECLFPAVPAYVAMTVAVPARFPVIRPVSGSMLMMSPSAALASRQWGEKSS